MSELRVRKLQELIKQEISSLLLNGFKNPKLGFVTVTEVALTGDLREATVYVSLYGKPSEKAASLAALNESKGFIRREIGKVIKTYYTPTLEFVEDTSLDYSMHIEGLLKKVNSEK